MTTDTAQNTEQTEQEEGIVETTGVMVNMPVALKQQIEKTAKGDDKTVSAYVREIMAREVGYDGPMGSTRRRSKYASEEERQAVLKAREKARRTLIKDLMSKYEDELAAATKQAEEQARAKVSGTTDAANTAEETEETDERPAVSGTPQPPQSFENR